MQRWDRGDAHGARGALDDPMDCLAKFKANRLSGLVVLAAILSGGVALG